jgi:hypothetical protein
VRAAAPTCRISRARTSRIRPASPDEDRPEFQLVPKHPRGRPPNSTTRTAPSLRCCGSSPSRPPTSWRC